MGYRLPAAQINFNKKKSLCGFDGKLIKVLLLFFKCLINQKVYIFIFNNYFFIFYFVELDDDSNLIKMMEIREH
jgi:hypothetical protein